MKLYDRPEVDERLEKLPELPPDVMAPDDISGLQPPTTIRPTGGAIRWMRWLAVILFVGAVGVLAALAITRDGQSEQADYTTVGQTPWDTATELEEVAVNSTARRHLDQLERLGTVQVNGTANRHLEQLERMGAQQIAVDYMATYGTDNPVFVQEVLDSMELYGTDNPVFVQEVVDTMELYGTDNPVFVESSDHPYAEFFG